MRPPLLQLGGEENFAAYQSAFDALFPFGAFEDVFGNQVVFSRDRCHHICFKTDDRVWNKGPRSQWSQERAERIGWIATALARPNYIRVSYSGAWIYMLEVERDKDANLSGELYAAIVNVESVKPGNPGRVYFLTAYTVDYPAMERLEKEQAAHLPAGNRQSRKAGEDPTKERKISTAKTPCF